MKGYFHGAALAASVAFLLVAACGGTTTSSATTSCTPNAQQACECSGGVSGVQSCNAAGTAFSVCTCGTASSTASDAGNTSTSNPGTTGDSGTTGGTTTTTGTTCTTATTFVYNGSDCNGTVNTASLAMSVSGNQVTAHRTPLTGATDDCTYTGTMSSNCSVITGGTYVCTGAGGGSGAWSATISGPCGTDGNCGIGTSWAEQENYTGSDSCTATWSAASQPKSAMFTYDGSSCNGTVNTANLAITLNGSQVTAYRTPLTGATDDCTYTGTMSANCLSITNGTYVCTGAGAGSGAWSATINGQTGTAGNCGLGTSWAEQENYTGSISCTATWNKQ